ncbi:MAG: hypothetical protein NC111_01080 [Bacteroides sp.]|nr:hypothetical protein [Bacteroides sp.]MCM1413556.1 hypothetical protein [Bacteroides sp.]MCM1471110.1 hypothetical protein [Bacteroides sp.]
MAVRKIIFQLLPCLMTWVVSACHGGMDTQGPVPRPTAYPRVATLDSNYVATKLPAGFEANAGAVVREIADKTGSDRRTIWADIDYPSYGATLHCTFIPTTEADHMAVMANRTERMSLNLGDNVATSTELSNPQGFNTVVLTSTAPMLTPLQFLADGPGWVISGALTFNESEVDMDSVKPLIDAVRDDLLHAGRKLSNDR